MGVESGKKGRVLEDAVEAIHDSILRSDPRYKGTEFTIDTRVRKQVRGVDYEIDVLVETPSGAPFPALWIFECKNWKDPVDGKEVVYLNEKVQALGAARGFLVAPAITASAQEIIKRETHLEFIQCTEEFSSLLNSAQLVYVSQDLQSPTVQVQWYYSKGREQLGQLRLDMMRCERSGVSINFMDLANSLLDKMAVAHRDGEFNTSLVEGTHWREVVEMISFKARELLLQEHEVAYFTFRFGYFVTFQRRRLISKFQLEGRGRSFAFEPIKSAATGQKIEIQLVERI